MSMDLLACFLLILQRLLRSTLFPYTTLFRSSWQGERVEQSPAARLREQGEAHGSGGRNHSSRHSIEHARGDRKSTRLNSSHTVISYAVFCLKKKKLLTKSMIWLKLMTRMLQI